MFCAELDGDGIEIKLEIAADAHGAFQAAAEHPVEGMLEEAALGDEEDQPERDEDADDPGQDAHRQGQPSPAMATALALVDRAARLRRLARRPSRPAGIVTGPGGC